ncbi:MAG: glycolate oxidase subunit GlcE [Burkholderiales bacterium]
MEQVIQQFIRDIRLAAKARTPVSLRGGNSKRFYGNPEFGEPLDVAVYRGIAEYEPTELVVTARCGTPLAELEAALAAKGQLLPFEPPHFGPGATLGGCIAAGLSGPRRAAAGSARDFVLGVRILDGRGDDLRFGGQVMKNVAGFDVSRVLTGSLGTLGVILEVSLKVLPVPVAEASLRLQMDEATAIRTFNEWGGKPLPVSATAWHAGDVHVRLSGARAAVDAAVRKLGGEPVAPAVAAAFWQTLREQTDPFFAQTEAPLWRLSLPPATPPLVLPGSQLVEWSGAQRWLKSNATANAIRAAVATAGGHATLFRAADKSAGTFHPLAPGLLAVHRKLKQTFDPAGIFNRGRLYPGF